METMPTLASEPLTPSIPPLAELAVAIPATELEHLSESSLDQLPYGVIALDLEGRVVRYNQAESRFARLDRRQVLGRMFFREVAPCTATPEFQGRFQALAESGAPGDTAQFTYIFDFKFGAQLVEIELLRTAAHPWILVLVNRQRFMARRQELPQGFAAPLQSELAAEEGAEGVLRGPREARVVPVAASIFSALRSAWDRLEPEGWRVFNEEWGFQWGRLAVVELETQASESDDKALRELTMQEVVDRLSELLARQGLGRLSVDFGPSRRGAFLVHLERSAIAEAVGFSETPRCDFLSGYLRAVFSHLARKLVVVREAACSAQGHARCSFVVASGSREEALEAALQAGDGDAGRVIEALLDASVHG